MHPSEKVYVTVKWIGFPRSSCLNTESNSRAKISTRGGTRRHTQPPTSGSHRRDAHQRDADSSSAPQSQRFPSPPNHHGFTGSMQGICAQTRRLHWPYAYRHTLEPASVVIVSNKREVIRIEAGTSISKLNRITGKTDPARRIVLGDDVSDP